MKTRLLSILVLLALSLSVSAQVPQSMNYQAVARDANGVVMSNQNISIQLSVLDGSATGTVSYMERHNVTTNTFGLFTVAVGQGQAMTGTFSAINWASGSKWMKVEMDPTGGTNYGTMGVSQLLSVPYALYAANGGSSSVNVTTSISGNGTAANPLSIAQQGATVGQTLIWNGTTWVPGTITGSDNWGTQSAVTNPSLTGNGTAASPLDIASQGAATGQVLGWNGTAWAPVTLSSGTGAGDNWGSQVAITTAAITGNGTAASPIDLASQGASAGQVLKWNGSAWVPGTDNNSGSTYTAGTGINIAGTTISNTGDINPLDDITNTTSAGGDLTGTYPNPTVANIQNHPISTTIPSSGQVLTWNGAAWTPATPSTGTTYTAGTGISIAGSVISNTGDLSATNELQTLSIAGNQLTISSGNSVTLPSTGGGSYTGGTGITITGSNVINSNWTLSGTDIYNNNAGNVGIGGVAAATDKLLVTPGTVNGGLRINKTNANPSSYGLWSLNNYTGHNSVVTSGFKGTTVYSGWNFSDPALHVNQTNGNTGMIVLRKQGTMIAPGIAALNGDGMGGFFYTADSSTAGMDALVGYYEGASTFAVGVRGRFLGSSRGYGAEGDYIGTADTSGGVLGYGINNSGLLGNHSYGLVGVYKFANSYGAGVWGVAGDSISVFPGGGTDYGVFGADPNGFGFAVYGDGALACSGTKSASVPTSQGNQLVYSIESPENWFEDFGTATLVNGVATINLDPMFMEIVVIDAQHPMVVTVTPEGDCNGVYVVKGTNSFQIKELNNGHSNVSVSYRITAKRANYQDHRFGSDPTYGAGDTRSKFHYVSPRPMNYDTMVEMTRAKKASQRGSGSNIARPGTRAKVLEFKRK